jgi:protocatechuate 3,4-dioxygenase beta subunit
MSNTPISARRSLLLRSLGLVAATAAPAWITPALAQGTRLNPTPRQTEGPFYPVALPADTDFDLLKNGDASYTRGQAAWVVGTLTDTRGVPVGGAVVEIWQCDHEGRYHHPGDGNRADRSFQGFGRVTVGKDGAYRFRTMRPARYSGRTPHIHVKVKLDGQELLTTQFYVEGDPGNGRDGLWRRLGDEGQAALTKPYVQTADGLRAEYPLVVQA